MPVKGMAHIVSGETDASMQMRIGLLFFAVLSTHLPQAYPAAFPILLLLFAIALASPVQKHIPGLSAKCFLYVSALGAVLFSQKDPLFLVVAGLILHSAFRFKSVLSVSCLLVAPLVVIAETSAYWGIPFTSYLIWFWGLPFFIVSFASCSLVKNKATLPGVLSLLTGLALLVNTLLLSLGQDMKLNLVKSSGEERPLSGMQIEGLGDNLAKNISDRAVLVSQDDAIKNIKGKQDEGYIVFLPATPSMNDHYLKSVASRGSYWLFAEHDDMGAFLTAGSAFNNDSHIRKGPWHAFGPIMTRQLKKASGLDPLYASNVGCTVRIRPFSYPLIWEYTAWGIPKMLAMGEFRGSSRFTYVGDSDPIVKFLAPYNANFLQSLLGKADCFDYVRGLFLLMLAAFHFIAINVKTVHRIAGMAFILFIQAVSPLHIDGKPVSEVDVSIESKGLWLSPHTETHYSSLAKFLSQENLTVAINRSDRPSKLSILLMGAGEHVLSGNAGKLPRIVMLMPQGKLNLGSDLYTVRDVPLGEQKANVFGTDIDVPDARTLIVNGVEKQWKVILDDGTIIIGTNSPQRIKGIAKLIQNGIR